MNRRALPVAALLLIVLTASGCASYAPSPPLSDSSAVLALVDDARADREAGQLARAAASLERALRIEPKNPRLWQELARVRLAQGDYAQTESLAARSNSWAGNDKRLRAENWRLVAEAREQRGDTAGARAATERAASLER